MKVITKTGIVNNGISGLSSYAEHSPAQRKLDDVALAAGSDETPRLSSRD